MDIVTRFNGVDGCWEWPFAKLPKGYGIFDTRRRGMGEHSANMYAHVFSYRLFNGQIPDGYCVLHRCDNPSCINPAHLFTGTQQDNMDDRAAKDRNGLKINRAQAIEILLATANYEQIAKKYGVSPVLVWAIKTRRCWRHIYPNMRMD